VPAETEPETRAHTEMEGLLLELGSAMDLEVWVDRGDRGRIYNGRPLGDIPGVIDELPTHFSTDISKTIRRIDVLWLRDGDVICAFEVESTTAVYSGLLRMADLLALQPHLNINLFIVAPEARRGDVKREINRPTFARALRPRPLSHRCRYISFDRLRDGFAGVLSLGLGRALRAEEYLDTLAESFE